MDCLFCQISQHKIPTELVHEDDQTVAFKDINPKAPVHLLVVPKKHIESIADLKEEDQSLIGRMIYQAKLLAEEFGIAKDGYKLVFNCRKHGGQLIDHLHLHLLGGKSIKGIV
jgi:histidine triad (HIT) family protein